MPSIEIYPPPPLKGALQDETVTVQNLQTPWSLVEAEQDPWHHRGWAFFLHWFFAKLLASINIQNLPSFMSNIFIIFYFVTTRLWSHDSSVGRALDWRSKGRRFDPGSWQSFGISVDSFGVLKSRCLCGLSFIYPLSNIIDCHLINYQVIGAANYCNAAASFLILIVGFQLNWQSSFADRNFWISGLFVVPSKVTGRFYLSCIFFMSRLYGARQWPTGMMLDSC